MIKRLQHAGVFLGAAVGLLLTAPLIAVFYVGEQLAGLVFVPFGLFDWLARVLPGDLVAETIQVMVSFIRAFNLGQTDVAGETIEGIMAIAQVLAGGMVAGALFFWILRRRSVRESDLPGLLLGVLAAIPTLFVLGTSSSFNDNFILNMIWVLVTFLGWGAAFGWVYNRIGHRTAEEAAAVAETAAASQPPGTPTPPAASTAAAREAADAVTGASVTAMDRRQFLIRLGGATAAITVVGAGLGAVLASRTQSDLETLAGDSGALPGAGEGLVPAPGTRSEITPVSRHYKIDIPLRSPEIEEAGYVLPITGLVDNPLELTLDDLRSNYPDATFEEYITISCISNRIGGDLIGTTRWTGVSMQAILAEAGVQEGAAYLIIESADGFHETVALDLINQDERIMLAYAWDGEPLTVDHGFPLRIYIPDRFGMKQPKWITSITVVDAYQEGYWVERGWDEDALVRMTSVIDTVAVDELVEEGGSTLVPIGGIAYAGARGIAKVEVSVDGGEWLEAQLREPLSDLSWVIWRYDWPFEAGSHTFAVRAFDGSGEEQIVTEARPRPSGATGIHTVDETLYA